MNNWPFERSLLKLGIVSDLHCNIDGLDRALEIMGPIDALLCLGDSISEYSFSNEVIGRLRELDALTILGNHEEIFLGAAAIGRASTHSLDGYRSASAANQHLSLSRTTAVEL